MKYGISSGLPDLPAGLKDTDYNLVAPIYRAVNALAGAVSVQTGSVQYSPDELSSVNPLTNLRRDSLTRRVPIKAGEALSYGHLVYITVVDSKFVAYKADNTIATGKRAIACVDTPGGIALDAFGEAVFLTGICSGIGGTVFGDYYYLGTAGAAQNAVTPGTIQQPIGIGLGSAGLYLTIGATLP